MSSLLKPKPVVAIAGATGHFGQYIAQTLLSPEFRPQFSDVILLSRTDPHAKYPQWTSATIRQYDESNLPSALQDVDVLINAVGSTGHAFKEKLLRAIPHTKIQLYFPSEFGADHYKFDFEHAEWERKNHHFQLCQQLLGPKGDAVKVCRVFSGLFLEDSIGPWFGFDTEQEKYEAVGSAGEVVSFTSLADTARSVARLALMAKEDVPDMVHLAGDSKSVREIAAIMEKAQQQHTTGGAVGKIQVTEVPLGPFKEKTLTANVRDPAQILRFLMGEGKLNHTASGYGNANELVNPGEKYWKWKTLTDLARESGGRP